ncbi:MAG: methylated-DNA--[protein]-cysteine S-methyltransferase [Bacteroidota bacterium]|nr:methylated-DNA--[protein]-cysteine S-methyltransferase [Bacteroidota bacterium]
MTDYQRIEKAIKYLISNFKKQPSLDEIAEYMGLSPFHFQRMFSQWAGVSPKKFLEHLTLEALKDELSIAGNISVAAERVGLSAQSRAYDLFVNIEAVTPHEYKTKGEGLTIEYGFADSPFGMCFIAATERGICMLQFSDENRDELIAELQQEWNNARIKENDDLAKTIVEKIFSAKKEVKPLNLLLRGTPFQLKVWRALLNVPFGRVVSYGDLAELTGDVNATRAVASAVARNPVGYIIPCHRVIRSEGVVGQYHWKPERKAAIIGWEKSRNED